MTHNRNGYVYAHPPPSTSQLLASVDDYEIPSKVYRSPYYSKESDAPEKAKEYGGLQYRLKGGDGMAILEPWVNDCGSPEEIGNPANDTSRAQILDRTGVGGWEYASIPPSVKKAKKWLLSHPEKSPKQQRLRLQSQVGGLTISSDFLVMTLHTD